MTYTTIKNILFYTFISLWILFLFFHYFYLPIIGDDWTIQGRPDNIYQIITNQYSHHQGRHFGELLTLFPRIFSVRLGFIPEPLYRYKFMLALVSSFLSISLTFILSTMVTNSKKIAFLLFSISSFYLSFSGRHDFITIAVLPMLYISMLPAVYYIRNHTLPRWMIENPYKTFGFWAVFIYMGSQVYDPVYMMGSVFFGMVILYLSMLNYKQDMFTKPLKDKISYILILMISIFYILLSLFAAIKNYFFSARINGYKNSMSFNIIDIYTRVEQALSPHSICIYAILLSIIISLFFLYKFIRNKKIDGNGYVYIALTASTVIVILLNGILDSIRLYVIYSSWFVVVAIICYLWNKKSWMQVLLPTIILGLFINVAVRLYPSMLVNTMDIDTLHALRKADQEGKTEIYIENNPFNSDIAWSFSAISEFALVMGYTENKIKIILTE